MSRDRLGKGLGALLGEYLDPEVQPGEIQKLPLVAIVPNPVQPRRVFNDEELEDLTSSIRENGLLQPLVVRPAPGSADRYELIAGERRFRALTRLEWAEAPVMVREASDETLLVLALVENLQREALNPLEEAEGYEALAEKHGMKQAEIAKAVGKDRSTVANLLRLLKLPVSIRKLVEIGSLTPGHARALLTLEDPIEYLHRDKSSIEDLSRWVSPRFTKHVPKIAGPSGSIVNETDDSNEALEPLVELGARRRARRLRCSAAHVLRATPT